MHGRGGRLSVREDRLPFADARGSWSACDPFAASDRSEILRRGTSGYEDADAVIRYESHEQGLGARLIEEFDEAVAVALEYPEAFATMPDAPAVYGLRWVMLRSFPIKLIYTV